MVGVLAGIAGLLLGMLATLLFSLHRARRGCRGQTWAGASSGEEDKREELRPLPPPLLTLGFVADWVAMEGQLRQGGPGAAVLAECAARLRSVNQRPLPVTPASPHYRQPGRPMAVAARQRRGSSVYQTPQNLEIPAIRPLSPLIQVVAPPS